jgi:hypothetical protein
LQCINEAMNIDSLVEQMKLAHARAKREVAGLEAALTAFSEQMKAGRKAKATPEVKTKVRRKMSAAARARISAAQKARWAKLRKKKK